MMGAYRYCLFCNVALQRPTPEEDLSEHGQQCYSCDRYQPRTQTRDEWLIEAFSRIEELEKEVNTLKLRLKLRKKK